MTNWKEDARPRLDGHWGDERVVQLYKTPDVHIAPDYERLRQPPHNPRHELQNGVTLMLYGVAFALLCVAVVAVLQGGFGG